MIGRMKRSRWRLGLAALAAVVGTAVTALLVWLATRNRGRRPRRTLLLAALAGVACTALIARLLIGPVVEALPETQVFLRAYVAMVAASLSVTAGFALIGALSAPALPLAALGVPPRARPYRVGVTLAVSGGLLLIPALLLLAGTAVYREGAFGPNLHLGVLLAAVAGLYGLLAGGLLGLLTVRAGQVWRPALAGLVGAALGGGACGLLFSGLDLWGAVGNGWGLLGLGAGLVVAVHLGWGTGVRWALGRLGRRGQRGQRRGRRVPAAGAVQVRAVATLALLGLGAGVALTRTLGDFVTTRPVDHSPPHGAPACAEPRDPLEQALWRVTTRNGAPDLSCGHAVYPLLRMPGPSQPGLPGERLEQPEPAAASGFGDVAGLVLTARREVLFTTMQWEEGPDDPGVTLAQALAQLHARVKADPASYPGGLSVRITLGNYPVVSTFEWGAEVWAALENLRAAGVPLSDPAHGWRVQLGNYAGIFPHSHVKLLVIDGETLMAAGFNYAYGHYPPEHPSGLGRGLYDLGLVVRGPAAQSGVGVFEDLWTRSKVVLCLADPDPGEPRGGCRLGGRGKREEPPAVRRAVPAGETRVFSLYRREGYDEADRAITALLGAAQEHVDLLHVNFSMNANCIVALLNPALCTERDRLPWMTALLGALERGVTVRLMTSPEELSGIENRVALAYLRAEMRRRGIPLSRVKARWFPTPLHAKATLIDGRMLAVGSMNLHYSSWTQGPLGLAEYDLATADPGVVGEFHDLYEDFWEGAEEVTLPPFLTEVSAVRW